MAFADSIEAEIIIRARDEASATFSRVAASARAAGAEMQGPLASASRSAASDMEKGAKAAALVAGGFAVAGVAALAYAAHTASGFELALNHSQAFAGQSAKDMEHVRTAILGMSTQMGISATQM